MKCTEDSFYSISSTFYEQLLRRYSFAKKLQSQTVIREKPCKALLYNKGSSKMLRKLTPEWQGPPVIDTSSNNILLVTKFVTQKNESHGHLQNNIKINLPLNLSLCSNLIFFERFKT